MLTSKQLYLGVNYLGTFLKPQNIIKYNFLGW